MDQKKKLADLKEQLFKKNKQLKENQPENDRELFERLARPKTEVVMARECQKQAIEEQDYKKNCTFHPQISQNSNYLAEIKYSQFNCPIYERLNQLEKERKQHIEDVRDILQQSREQEETMMCGKIYTYPKVADQAPLHLRVQDVIKEKQMHLDQLKQTQLQNEQGLFHPQINAQSSMLAEIRNNGENVIERLTFIKHSQIGEEPGQFNFQPQTNRERNAQLLQNDSASFLQRQQLHLHRSQERTSQMEQEVYNGCTFQPKVLSRGPREENIFVKLHSEQKIRDQRLNEKQQVLAGSFSFKPSLDPNSRQLAMQRSFEDLVRNEEGEMKKQRLQEEKEDRYQRECSFYPSTSQNSRYSGMHSEYSYEDSQAQIRQRQLQKEQKRQQEMKEQKEKEMEECTFKPQLWKGRAAEIVEVRGMEEYMQRVDLVRRKKQEQEQTEQRVFEISRRYDANDHQSNTKQMPFKLSSGRNNNNDYAKIHNKKI